MPPGLTNTLTSICSPVTQEMFHAVMDTVGGSLVELERAIRTNGSCVDVSDSSAEELRSIMSRAFQDAEKEVTALWAADHVAVRATYRVLLRHIDDLYYPGMDDLLIIEESRGVRCVLFLDHEERLYTASLEGLMHHSR